MDKEHPALEVGVWHNKGVNTTVYMVYRDGQSSHAGTQRSYFYDDKGKQLRGHHFINNVTFLPEYRRHWQEFLNTDNRTFKDKKGIYGEASRKLTLEKAYKDWLESVKERNGGKDKATNLNAFGVSEPKHKVGRQPNKSKPNGKAKNAIGEMTGDSLELMSASDQRDNRTQRKVVNEPVLPLPKPSFDFPKRRVPWASDITERKKPRLDASVHTGHDKKKSNFDANAGLSKERQNLDHLSSVDSKDVEGQNLVQGIADDKDSQQSVETPRLKKLVLKANRTMLPRIGSGPPKITRNFKFETDNLSFWDHPGVREHVMKARKEVWEEFEQRTMKRRAKPTSETASNK